MIKAYNIPALFEEIVINMRESNTITAISDNGDGSYTVTTYDTEHLQDGDFVTISGTANFDNVFQISNVTDTSFDIEETAGYSTETGLWTANAPYFDKGHLAEIIENLFEKDGSISYKNQKYPLIWLVLDMEEVHNEPAYNVEINPTFVILKDTKQTYKSGDRYDNVFVPVLHPLFERFIRAIADSGYFLENHPEQIIYTKIDHLNWGRIDNFGSRDLKLNEFIDAIEVKLTLRLKFLKTICQT